MTLSLFALSITILCSILWGLFDGIRKHISSQAHLIAVLFYLSCGFALFFFLWTSFSGFPLWNSAYVFPAILTVLFNALANFFYIKAISISPITNTVPFLAFTSLFTALTGFLFLGEALNYLQILGIVILVCASLIINGELKHTGSFRAEMKNLWHSFLKERGAHYMIAVSLLWALSAPFDKLAVSAMSVSYHGFFQSVLIAVVYFLYLIFTKHLSYLADFKKTPWAIVLGSLVSCLALGLQFYAYQLMKVSVFESLKRAVALFTAVLVGMVFFKEKITKLKLIGICLIISGGAMILLT